MDIIIFLRSIFVHIECHTLQLRVSVKEERRELCFRYKAKIERLLEKRPEFRSGLHVVNTKLSYYNTGVRLTQ